MNICFSTISVASPIERTKSSVGSSTGVQVPLSSMVRVTQVRITPKHTVYRERFSVDEKLVELRKRLRTDKQVNLSRVFERCVIKEEVVCFFLAILELARLREITVAQSDNFEDILIAEERESEPAIPYAQYRSQRFRRRQTPSLDA